jgi:hypothetical protein
MVGDRQGRYRISALVRKLLLLSTHWFGIQMARSRREYRSACDRAGKGGNQIERCVISTFRVAESMGFNGDVRQWEHLLRIGD